jgi:hypothetical protein
VIDLLELAAAVLVHLAVARQDVQFLQQRDGLAFTDFRHVVGAVMTVARTLRRLPLILLHRSTPADRFEDFFAAARVVIVETSSSTIQLCRSVKRTVRGSMSGYLSYSASAIA